MWRRGFPTSRLRASDQSDVADDYPSLTTIMPTAGLPLAPPDLVACCLPEAIADAFGRPGMFATTSRGDELHHWIRTAIRVFDASALRLLDRDPWERDDLAAIRAASDGWVVSALMPEEAPDAIRAIDEILRDTDRLNRALPDQLTQAELAQHRADTRDVDQFSSDCSMNVYIVWFLQRLQSALQQALDQRAAVVHARYIWLNERR